MFHQSAKRKAFITVSRVLKQYHKAYKEALITVSFCIILSLTGGICREHYLRNLENTRQLRLVFFRSVLYDSSAWLRLLYLLIIRKHYD